MRPTSVTNSLRPELADACLNLWLLDGRDEWRVIAREHYLAMKRWNKARFGYADLADVTTRCERSFPRLLVDRADKCYYLVFAGAPRSSIGGSI